MYFTVSNICIINSSSGGSILRYLLILQPKVAQNSQSSCIPDNTFSLEYALFDLFVSLCLTNNSPGISLIVISLASSVCVHLTRLRPRV